MKRTLALLALFSILATGCGGTAATQTQIPTEPPPPTDTQEPTLTETATITLTPTYSAYPGATGPTGFPAGVDPLTGLLVSDPSLLERRPLLIKVSNEPRIVRPQWGLSFADIVFEYYTEYGGTRFAGLFLGRDAEMVGPIRSGRFIDVNLIRGYKAVFAFGLAYMKVLDRLYSSEFADRLVVEGSSTPLFRYDPTVMNHLMVSTSALSQYITNKGVENGRQNLDGMSFQMETPAGGQPVSEFVNWWSGAIYNRWQYDPALGKYLRFQETETDTTGGQNTQYAQMTDRLTGEPLAFDNVVVLQVFYEYYDVEVYDPQFIGSGKAYAFRDGQVYEVQWQRPTSDSVISLAYPDGTPFPFKPGNTWFEVMGQASTVTTTEQGMWFKHLMP
jgi:Protein of unknown function (DUF3048) N-terminal domain/Protein of unknown function (DUF3048) C-terminal domain